MPIFRKLMSVKIAKFMEETLLFVNISELGVRFFLVS